MSASLPHTFDWREARINKIGTMLWLNRKRAQEWCNSMDGFYLVKREGCCNSHKKGNKLDLED